MKKDNFILGGVVLALLLSIIGLVGGNNQSVHQLSAGEVKAIVCEVQGTPADECGALGSDGTRFPHGIALGVGVNIANVGGLTIGSATTTAGSQGVPTYYSYGGRDYATVQYAFSSATNTPVFAPNPFGTATTTFGADGITVQITAGSAGDMTFDIATSSSASTNATTTFVLVRAVNVPATASPGPQFDATYYPNVATSSAAAQGVPTGVLPAVNGAAANYGSTNWFLRGGTSEGVMLRIASSTVSQSWTGTMSLTFAKP